MAFLNLFKKKDENERFYHAISKIGVDMVCDYTSTQMAIETFDLPKCDSETLHIEKRFLAIATIIVTTGMCIESDKKNKLISIFKSYLDDNDGIKDMSTNFQKSYNMAMQFHINAYLDVEAKVRKANAENPFLSLDLLCNEFSKLFANFCEQSQNEIYIEIGRTIFNGIHAVIKDSLQKHL
jgi:hypothetical protein